MLASDITNLLNSQVVQTPARDATSQLGKDDFLLLLVKQLGNQDPLDPMTNEDFISQLAQFGSLEQQINLNTSFEQFLSFQQLTQATSLLGKDVICLIQTEDGIESATGTVEQVMSVNGIAILKLSDGSEVPLSSVVLVQDPAGDSQGDSQGDS
jgi:flagellar basal-body rod modification protein FlgD